MSRVFRDVFVDGQGRERLSERRDCNQFPSWRKEYFAKFSSSGLFDGPDGGNALKMSDLSQG
jgi:hypothetical protein